MEKDSKPTPLRLVRDALARHGGALPLAKRLLGILLREGPRGLAGRGAHHVRRMHTPSPSAPRAPSAESASSGGILKLPGAPSPGLRPGLNLVGHPYAVLGRAEDIRTAACACDSAGIPFGMMNLHGDHGRADATRHADFPFFHLVEPVLDKRASLFMLNADEMHFAERLGEPLLRGPYNIGCFAWELSRFPGAWTQSLRNLHEVWAPTRFIQQAVADACSLPVVLMPFAVEPGPATEADRAEWGLEPDSFVFLFFFDFRSYVQRKNPWAVLDAFQRAFPPAGGDRVQLLIKVHGFEQRRAEYQALLDSGPAEDPRIRIVDQVLDDRGIKSLVNLCDSFVSLHRSEGFGRGLAEAMYYGKPVVATGYSGNVDFMHPGTACLVDYALTPVGADDYPYGEGQLWAEADVDHAAWYMRKLVDDPAYARRTGAAAGAYLKEFHSYRAVGEHYRKRLDKLGLL